MTKAELEGEWRRKGASLSDKTARVEYALTEAQIRQAIRAGRLHFRVASMHGNPWLRLLRREVEELVRKGHGNTYLKEQQAKAELARVNRELRRLKTRVAELERRKALLLTELCETTAPRR